MKCIRKHCPAGLVTVPRDLDYDSAALSNQWSGDQQMCAALFCNDVTSAEELSQCVQSKCPARVADVNELEDGRSVEGLSEENPTPSVLEILRTDLCATENCVGYHGGSYLRCFKRFCPQTTFPTGQARRHGWRGAAPKRPDQHDTEAVVSKRRVNAGLALCLDKHGSKCQGARRAICLTSYCTLR